MISDFVVFSIRARSLSLFSKSFGSRIEIMVAAFDTICCTAPSRCQASEHISGWHGQALLVRVGTASGRLPVWEKLKTIPGTAALCVRSPRDRLQESKLPIPSGLNNFFAFDRKPHNLKLSCLQFDFLVDILER